MQSVGEGRLNEWSGGRVVAYYTQTYARAVFRSTQRSQRSLTYEYSDSTYVIHAWPTVVPRLGG